MGGVGGVCGCGGGGAVVPQVPSCKIRSKSFRTTPGSSPNLPLETSPGSFPWNLPLEPLMETRWPSEMPRFSIILQVNPPRGDRGMPHRVGPKRGLNLSYRPLDWTKSISATRPIRFCYRELISGIEPCQFATLKVDLGMSLMVSSRLGSYLEVWEGQ